MATLEETLISILSPVFSGRFYWIEPEENQSVSPPYAIGQLMGGEDVSNNFDGAGGLRNYKVQIMIVAKRAADIASKSSAVRAAMINAGESNLLTNLPLGPGVDLVADETVLRGRALDYSIWFNDLL